MKNSLLGVFAFLAAALGLPTNAALFLQSLSRQLHGFLAQP